MCHTLRALRAAGHEARLVSPFDPTREDAAALGTALRDFCEPHLVAAVPRSIGLSTLLARARGVPLEVSRHALSPVRAEVERVLQRHACDVVHAEQLQALAQCEPARRRSLPLVLRAQNVESDLWGGRAATWPFARVLVRRESLRLARHEGRAVRDVAATVALTDRDAERLRALSGRPDTVHRIAAPFPSELPPAADQLSGEPAVVLLGSDWFPNRDGAAWFCRAVWPVVRAQCPRAVLHLFADMPGVDGSTRAIVTHGAPAESRMAFPSDAILAVPLRIASGVRVKILEAWARGVPVVATPEAASGLDAGARESLLTARGPREFAAAIHRVHADRPFARACVEAGRAVLRDHHDPARVVDALVHVYAHAARGLANRRISARS